MSKENKKMMISDDELTKITGGTVPTEPCPKGRFLCDPYFCRMCGYANGLETGVAESCSLGYPNKGSGVIPI